MNLHGWLCGDTNLVANMNGLVLGTLNRLVQNLNIISNYGNPL
jgi:hypothetical protein